MALDGKKGKPGKTKLTIIIVSIAVLVVAAYFIIKEYTDIIPFSENNSEGDTVEVQQNTATPEKSIIATPENTIEPEEDTTETEFSIVESEEGSITMAAWGMRFNPGISFGDTWDTAWLANDSLFVQHNDGHGFYNGGSVAYKHDRICEVFGTPEEPETVTGINMNPGQLGYFFGDSYSTGLYEVDGILYHIICYSYQDAASGTFTFRNASILKSSDGGANWVNCLGETNVMPPDSLEESMFPNQYWAQVNFVQYGKGGEAPDIDNAQNYVYLCNAGWDNYKLVRIKRDELPELDKNKIEYYTGGDGMLDENWDKEISKAAEIYRGTCSPTAMTYNFELQRYIIVAFNSNSFASPEVHSTLRVYDAPHPWGPWNEILYENVQNKVEDNLTWSFPVAKFISGDGKKMWSTASGAQYNGSYELQFIPFYLTKEPVKEYEAENAALNGAEISTQQIGYEGEGYVTGFDEDNDQCSFNINVQESGAYIFKIRYHTDKFQDVSCYINGQYDQTLELGQSEQIYDIWTEYTMFACLHEGENTISIKKTEDDSGDLDLDKFSLALYWALPN